MLVAQRKKSVVSKEIMREVYKQMVAEVKNLKDILKEALSSFMQNRKGQRLLVQRMQQYKKNMQIEADIKASLYRMHSSKSKDWAEEKKKLSNYVQELEIKLAGLQSQNFLLEEGLQKLENDGFHAAKDYSSTVRRLALAQMKHTKVVREMILLEKAHSCLLEEYKLLEKAFQSSSSEHESRLSQLAQNTQNLQIMLDYALQLQDGMVPSKDFEELRVQHLALEQLHRNFVENQADINSLKNTHEIFQTLGIIDKYILSVEEASRAEEKSRQLQLMIDNSGHIPHVEAQLKEDLLNLSAKQNTSSRWVELANSAKESTEQALTEACARMTLLEEQLRRIQSELDCAYQSNQDLRASLAKSVPETRLQEAQATILKLKNEQLLLEDKLVEDKSTTQSEQNRIASLEKSLRQCRAEIVVLKASIRNIGSRDQPSEVQANLVLEICHLQKKEALARDAQERSELSSAANESKLRLISKSKAEMEIELGHSRTKLREVMQERRHLIQKLHACRRECAPIWKTREWARTLECYRIFTSRLEEALANTLEAVNSKESILEQTTCESDGENNIAKVVYIHDSDVRRELKKCQEELVETKLIKSKLERSEVMRADKIMSLEKMNMDLHYIIDQMDSEAIKHQTAMESEVQDAENHRRLLEDQVEELQSKYETLSSELQLQKNEGSHWGKSSKCEADREFLIQKIESAKDSKLMAEILRQKTQDLEKDLARKNAQLEALQKDQTDLLERLQDGFCSSIQKQDLRGYEHGSIEQIQAYAECSIRDMRGHITAKEEKIKSLQTHIEMDRQTYLAQHSIDRQEIENLTNRLLNDKKTTINSLWDSIAFSKAAMKKTITTQEEAESDDVPSEQLQYQVKEQETQIKSLLLQAQELAIQKQCLETECKNRVAAAEERSKKLEEDFNATKLALHATDLQRSWRSAERKLRLQLSGKDLKLRQLKDVIKSLEEKLVEALKKKADETMCKSSWIEQERLTDQLSKTKHEKESVEKELHEMKTISLKLQSELSQKERTIEVLEKKQEKEAKNIIRVKAQPEKEKLARPKLGIGNKVRVTKEEAQDATNKVSSLYAAGKQSDYSEQALLKAEKKNKVLSERIAELEKMLEDSEQFESCPAREPAKEQGHNFSDAKVLKWEECKRLQKKIEGLRAQVNKKNQDLSQCKREIDKLNNSLASSQAESYEYVKAIKKLQDQLQKATCKPTGTLDLTKVEEYVARSDAVEKKSNANELENALLRRQLTEMGREIPKLATAASHESTGDISDMDRAVLEQKLFEANLRQNQAEAQAMRLKDTISVFFAGENLECRHGSSSSACDKSRKRQLSEEREEELLTTINSLKYALERSQQSIPLVKHRQVVEKRKELQKQVTELSDEVMRQRGKNEDMQELVNQCDELQKSNLVLRRQLNKFQEMSRKVDETLIKNSQMAEELLTQEKIISSLKEQQVSADDLQHQGTQTACEELTLQDEDKEREEVLQSLKDRVVDLELENHDLRKELEGFDESFFEEIEDMKHEHHHLTLKVMEYENTIQQLTQT